MQIELSRDELDLLEALARRHAIESKHTRDYAAARALWVRLVDRLIAEDDAPDEAAQFEASEREVMRKAIANFENGGTDGQCG